MTNPEPPFRFSTKEAQIEIALELNMPPPDNWQDWEYIFARGEDLEQYLEHYQNIKNEDKKFVLMQIIIQATNDKERDGTLEKYWLKLQPLLLKDFNIHQYTIYYWCVFENENIEDCFAITLFMREFWGNFR